jgi:phenylalanyl-tRNA synthetase beta chain
MELETEVVRATLARVGVATESATDDDVVPIGDGGRGVPLDAVAASEALVAIVPPHRRDLVIEADVAEEVARVRGYDAVPSVVPATGMPAYRPDPRRALDLVRDLLSGRGLVEVLTHALIAPEAHRRLGFGPDDGLTIRVANPVSADHSELRRSLLPEHLRVLVDNERQRRSDVAIFEIGTLHERSDGGPAERRELGLLLAGTAAPIAWDVPARAVDAGDAKGLLDWLAERLGAERLTYRPVVARDGVDHPGRTAAVIGKTASGHAVELGRVGELDPRYLDAVDARSEHVVFASVDLDGLLRLRPARVRVGSLPRLPGIERDIAVVADRDRAAGEIEAAILGAGGPLLSSVRLFDRYEGPPLGDSEVSLAYRLRFEPGDRVIADEELERLVGGIVDALRERTGARLRS